VGSKSFLRVLAPIFLCAHIILRSIHLTPNIFLDLFLYNLIAVCVVLVVLASEFLKDVIGRYALATGIIFWIVGSVLSTAAEFFSLPLLSSNIAKIFYLLFYPCMIVAIPRILGNGKKFGLLEALDAMILGFGLGSLGSALLLRPVVPKFSGEIVATFFAICFPVGDVVLLALVLTLASITAMSLRSGLLSAGIFCFSLSDFYFLWLNVNHRYTFGALSDDVWLLALILISIAITQSHKTSKNKYVVPSVLIVLSIMTSATLLSITALRPGYLPNFILFPTITTLVLAFVRMTIALRESRSIGEERILARTDDLTGLANRRRFISDLNVLSQGTQFDSALLLLDLDGFKPINDKYGHAIGDRLLKEVSLRFSRVLPDGSVLARLGGDEFAAIVSGERATTIDIARSLRAALSYPFSIGVEEITVGVSIGHVSNDGASDLMRRADLAMYQAKREGVGVWSEPVR